MKVVIPKGSTSRILTVFIQDSSSTTGAGLGSLTNASSIVGGYVREGATGVALAVDEDVTTEGTYQAPSVVGKVRIGTPANMRSGTYELHFHNDLWATGAETVTITLGGAANMAPLNIEVQLSDPVRGLGSPTALPNAAADAAGGLPISDAGGLDLDALNTNVSAILVDTGTTLDGKLDAIDNFIDTEVAAIITTLGTPAGASMSADIADLPTVAEFNARTLAAASYFDPATDKVFLGDGAHGGTSAVITAERIVVASTTSNEPAVKLTGNGTGEGLFSKGGASGSGITGCGGATKGAGMVLLGGNTAPPAYVSGGDGLAALGTGSRFAILASTIQGDLSGSVGSVTGEINTASGTLKTLDALDTAQDTQHGTTQTAIGDVPTVAEFEARTLAAASYATASALDAVDNFVDTEIAAIQSTLAALFTTALVESYNTDGAAPTMTQAVMGIYQLLTEGEISGTAWQVNKLDGTTAAFGITLDADPPTTKTRSS